MPHFTPPRRTHTSGFLAFALGAALLWAPGALAADLDPGYADVPPPMPQQVVSFGSGWYVRGDIGAADDQYKVGAVRDASTNGVLIGIQRSNNLSYDLSLGGGYSFTNSFRADIIADFHQPTQSYASNQKCVSVQTSACTLQGRLDRYNAMVNGYYDLGTWSIVTPYVGVGVGYAFGTLKSYLYGDPNGAYTGSIGYHGFAYAAMAGAAFDVYNHTKIDIGYRFIDEGKVQNVRLYNNEIRAGVRYMIDN